MLEIVCDNFAGGGGASCGIEMAGFTVTEACNHDLAAIAMHKANHPHTRHWTASINSIDPRDVARGRPIGLAWFSPACTHHSKARGGLPRSKQSRDLAWVVVHWAERVKPRVIILENVEEFVSWTILLENGQPCPISKGLEFLRWVKALRKAGYVVEWRELRAHEYGAPTIRKRLFVVARRDGEPIVWPEPTHGPGLLPYRTAAEIIDWSMPVRSIFGRKKPLAPATLRRIARGIHKYVLKAAKPFIVPVTHPRDSRVHDIDEPLRTVTGSARGDLAVVAPSLMVNNTGHSGAAVTEPVPTVTTGNHHFVTAPFFVPRYGEREGQEPRCQTVETPISTVVPTSNGASLVAAFMAQHNSKSTGHEMEDPVSTICSRGAHQNVVAANLLHLRNNCDGRSAEDPIPTLTAGGGHVGVVASNLLKFQENSTGQDVREPLHTVMAGAPRFAEVRAFLTAYYGTDQTGNLEDPLATATTHDRFGLVTVQIEGVDYVLTDIGMRMLEPRELFNAQGFPPGYVIDPIFNGKPLTRTLQVKCCGNSVCPPLAAALVKANVQLREIGDGPFLSPEEPGNKVGARKRSRQRLRREPLHADLFEEVAG